VLTVSPLMSRALVVATVAGGVAAGAAPASADACVGSRKSVVACASNRDVYSDCVYLGTPPCTQVTVVAPICLYGTIGQNGEFQSPGCA
jgi:hypothetical protein